ncbi:hypothetical protein Lal_00018465 [Lupinus albus]|nr:hypothetical protein Lal_00018465 [Lupinus albus]
MKRGSSPPSSLGQILLQNQNNRKVFSFLLKGPTTKIKDTVHKLRKKIWREIKGFKMHHDKIVIFEVYLGIDYSILAVMGVEVFTKKKIIGLVMNFTISV